MKTAKGVRVLSETQFSLRIVSGKAFHDPSWSKVFQIQGLGVASESVDSYNPKKVRSLEK